MSTSDAGLPPDAPDLSETQFTLEKLLGQGGFGAAYQVFNRGLRRRCVLKLLTDIKNPNFVARFFREAQVMANLDHPAIPRVHEVNTLRDGRPYFVMELVDGLSLGDHLVEKGGPLSVAEACEICAAAAEGLAAAHEMGVVHRDIKLPNLLISRKGQVKVIDFGIAHQRAEDMDGLGANTMAGQLLGTPRYMSPEQILGQSLGPASDVYSLAVVLSILLTGRSPFDGSAQQMMMGHAMQPPPTLQALAGIDFPAPLEELFARMLEKDPTRRPSDGVELARALRRVGTSTAVAAAPAPADDLRNAPTATPETLTAPKLSQPAAMVPEPSLVTGATPNRVPAPTELRLDLGPVRAMLFEPSITLTALPLDQRPRATQVLAAMAPATPGSARLEPTPSALQTFVRTEDVTAAAPRRSVAPWIALTVLGLAVLGVVAFLLVGRRNEPGSATATEKPSVSVAKSAESSEASTKAGASKVDAPPKVEPSTPSTDVPKPPTAAKPLPAAKPSAKPEPVPSTAPPLVPSVKPKPVSANGSGEEI